MQTIHLLGKPTEKPTEKSIPRPKSTSTTLSQNDVRKKFFFFSSKNLFLKKLPQTPQTSQRRTFQENSPMGNFSFSPTPTSTPLSPFSPGFQQLPMEAQLEIQRQLNALQQQILQQQQAFNPNQQNQQQNQSQQQQQQQQQQPVDEQNQNVRTTIFEITIGPQIWDFIVKKKTNIVLTF